MFPGPLLPAMVLVMGITGVVEVLVSPHQVEAEGKVEIVNI